MPAKHSKKVLLVGNPNVGKSTIFNALCHTQQKTGNYAGVTVASQNGFFDFGKQRVEVVDLPGSYSIYPSSEDEAIFTKYLLDDTQNFAGVVYVLDCLNIKRGLLLLQQIQDLQLPVLIVANQIDEAQKRGISINFDKISTAFQAQVIQTNAKEGAGIDALREHLAEGNFQVFAGQHFEIPMEQRGIIHNLSGGDTRQNYRLWLLLASESSVMKIDSIETQLLEKDTKCLIPKRLQTQETIRRYAQTDKILPQLITKTPDRRTLFTEKLDRVLVHPFWGYVVFAALLLVIFQLVFFMASYPMDWIDIAFNYAADAVRSVLPPGPLQSLLTDGLIPGIGGIVIFAPQIGLLLYLLYLLEDSGYMARVVFLMDRLLRPFGLNGKSIVPLVSGVACAIPAIMSTRNIENIKERLITILVTPFMTCSARLPVYSIIIALVIPKKYFLGISYQALALLVMYALGFGMALLSAWVLKKVIKKEVKSFLVLELPAYKAPMFGYDLRLTLQKVWDFITGAGKVIFAVSIILWALSYVGPKNGGGLATDVALEDSYLGSLGRGIEPVVAPLGYDWKMGVGIISSFAAREVFVGTMSTLYSLDDDAEEGRLIDKMRTDRRADGQPVFSLATGVSILLYYAFAMQCISTIAIVYRETRSYRWTLIQVLGMTGLAYLVSFLAYQLLK